MADRRFVVLDDAAALAAAAAEHIAGILERVGGRGAVCLTGGGTIGPVYRRLAQPDLAARLPLDRLDWFFGDERMVPADDPRSNAGQARATLLDPLGVPAARIHAIPTDDADPHTSSRRYAAELAGFYGSDRLDPARPLFDLVLLGLGSDGHVASLFPGRSALAERDRWAVGVDTAGLAPFVPRVTLTLPALASSRAMLFIVAGAEKRPVIAQLLAGVDLPAARVRCAGPVLWLVDRAAAPDTLIEDRS